MKPVAIRPTYLLLACILMFAAFAPAEAQTPKMSASRGPAAVAPNKDLRLEAIRTRGKIYVGVAPIVPWAFKDPKGDWYGFEIDVARQLASEVGVELVFVERPFRSLISALVAGEIDIIASGMSITPQRALAVDFSNAYSRSELEFAVRAGAPATQDFNVAGTNIGVRATSLVEAVARDALPNASIQSYATNTEAYAALIDGRVAAVMGYAPAARLEALRSPDKFAVARNRGDLPYSVEAFAVRHGESTLVNVLNAWIAYHRADGWLDERHRDWFESLNWVARLAQ